MFSKTPTSKLADYAMKTLPDVEATPFELRDIKTKTSAQVTLSQACGLVKPGTCLIPIEPESDALSYKISPLATIKLDRHTRPSRFKRLGHGKEFHLTTTCSPDYLSHILSKAYHFIEQGVRVEFHLRPLKKEKIKTIDWSLHNCMHLRPECIIASMPPGTAEMVKPIVDHDQIVWVLENHGKMPDPIVAEVNRSKSKSKSESESDERIPASSQQKDGLSGKSHARRGGAFEGKPISYTFGSERVAWKSASFRRPISLATGNDEWT